MSTKPHTHCECVLRWVQEGERLRSSLAACKKERDEARAEALAMRRERNEAIVELVEVCDVLEVMTGLLDSIVPAGDELDDPIERAIAAARLALTRAGR